MSTEDIEYLLTVNISDAVSQLRQAEAVLMRTLSLVRRISGDENLNNAITMLQRMITIARSLQYALIAIQSATPFGMVLGLVSLVSTSFMAQDMIEYSRRGL